MYRYGFVLILTGQSESDAIHLTIFNSAANYANFNGTSAGRRTKPGLGLILSGTYVLDDAFNKSGIVDVTVETVG